MKYRRLLKGILPRAFVDWIKGQPAYELYNMRHSPLGRPFPEIRFPEGTVETSGDFSPCRPNGRTAIFAMFAGDGRIPAATVYYLKGLSSAVDNVVLVGDCPVFSSELEKIRPYVRHCEFVRHGEYDFGSYKRGWNYLRSSPALGSSREAVLCNDSCYGPVVPFESVFERMRKRECDFWGLCDSDFYRRHFQSYFLVFGSRVLRSAVLDGFLSRVVRERSVMDVILHYEIGLSLELSRNGFVGAAAFPSSPEKPRGDNPTLHPISLTAQGCPLVKVKALEDGECNLDGIGRTLDLLRETNPALYDLLPKG